MLLLLLLFQQFLRLQKVMEFVSFCVGFTVPFKLSLFINVEFKLFFPVLSGKNGL